MGLKASVTITGDKRTIQKLAKLGSGLIALDRAMDGIGKEVSGYFANQVFASQGGIIGESWPELSELYQQRKAEDYPGRGPLVRTGEMQGGFIYEADGTGVTIGNTSDHFAYHQSDEPRNVLPRRAMMKVNSDVRTIVSRLISDDVTRKIREAGF